MKNNFWNFIQEAKNNATDYEDRADQLNVILSSKSPDEIIAFENEYQKKMVECYRWDLWGAAYVINGGCSDDGFHYFCAFLISEGEEVFSRALKDPESLVHLDIDDDAELEEFSYVASEVYEEKTGNEIPQINILFPAEPIGEDWDEGDLDERFPKLSKKYG